MGFECISKRFAVSRAVVPLHAYKLVRDLQEWLRILHNGGFVPVGVAFLRAASRCRRVELKNAQAETEETWMMMLRMHSIAIAVCALLATALQTSHAAEPSAKSAGSPVVVMDNQGRVIRTLDPAPSREAQATKEAETERAVAAARADEERKRKDRVLTDSYTTEAEIDLARNRATSVLDAQMDVGKAYITMLAKRRAELVKGKSASGYKPLASDDQEIARLDSEIERQNAMLVQKRLELERVVARYTADKGRWH